jgi:hypothetical protein
MVAVETVDRINAVPKRQQRGDDRSSAGPEYQVKSLVQRFPGESFNLTENPKGVKAFCSPAIKAENTAHWCWRAFVRGVGIHACAFVVFSPLDPGVRSTGQSSQTSILFVPSTNDCFVPRPG